MELLCQSDRSSSAGAVLLRFLLWARKKFEKNEQENSAEYARGKKYDSARRTDIIFFFFELWKKTRFSRDEKNHFIGRGGQSLFLVGPSIPSFFPPTASSIAENLLDTLPGLPQEMGNGRARCRKKFGLQLIFDKKMGGGESENPRK